MQETGSVRTVRKLKSCRMSLWRAGVMTVETRVFGSVRRNRTVRKTERPAGCLRVTARVYARMPEVLIGTTIRAWVMFGMFGVEVREVQGLGS